MDELDIAKIKGLSEREAEEILARDGYNELPSARKRSLFSIAASVFREPMFMLLVAGGIIYLLLGDKTEALMLLGFVFVVIGITLYQERKTENALQALRDLSSPRALVIRESQVRRIPGREVVRGDIVMLSEGDRVPADGVLLVSRNLNADESLLTGESVPVRKVTWTPDIPPGRLGGDDLPYIYSGTMVVSGQGVAKIQSTGTFTEIGKIGVALKSLQPEKTPLQVQTNRLVRNLALTGLGLSVFVIIAYGFTRGKWLEGLLAGITLAMAVLPEEFPVVLTVFLALGAWRISRNRVLTRRMPAIETLGAATVLCVDKTGTLTINRMSVSEIYSKGRRFYVPRSPESPLPEEFHSIAEFSILASQRNPYDPMEKAIKTFGDEYLSLTEHLHADWTLVREYPLSPRLLAMSHVWKSPSGSEYVIAAKGAPEAIADLCHMDEKERERLAHQVSKMADNGLRVIGVARAYFRVAQELPVGQHDFTFEFLGLMGLADPIRPSVPDAIRECYGAGIRVIMITGDYPATAENIGRQAGLAEAENIITGYELDEMPDVVLRKKIKDVNIFARMVPEHKLRIVRALKANGEVVAMTGDGVNDAPALKAADIGIAMGSRGTDVARESAGLVLLDDDFSSIVAAVRLGRRIFDNLRKAMAYIIAVHVPIAGLSLIPIPIGWPLILMPVHILFMELIIDPSCSIVFEAEPEEDGIMNRPPRDPGEPIFDRRTLTLSALQGSVVLGLELVIFFIGIERLDGAGVARAMTFTTLILSNLALIVTNLSWSRTAAETVRIPNLALWLVLAGATVVLVMVLSIPFLRGIFRFAPITPLQVIICLAAALTSIIWFETAKIVHIYRGKTLR